MVMSHSDSVSTFSSVGSSQFVDARSTFTNARSFPEFEDAKDTDIVSHQEKDQSPLTDTEMTTKNEINSSETEEINNIQIDGNGKESSNSDLEVKTEQPKPVAPPKAFVSKDEKIRQLQKEKEERSYQRQESHCHEYICSNNIIEVLDLPGWKFWVCGLCTLCCNSCFSSSTSAIRTTAAG
jgi:hypothetical protein